MLRRLRPTRGATRAALSLLLAFTGRAATLLAQSQSPPPEHTVPARTSARRSADGRLEVSATAAHTPIRVDGVLDEAVWRDAEPARDFVQAEPNTGANATEATEVRVAFDAEYLYIGAVMHDREPSRIVVNDIKKDFRPEDQDAFEVLLDTFGDRRNGYVFSTNVEGAKSDRQVALEGREQNTSWDAVWQVGTRRTSDGWVAEIAIPFRALRFDPRSTRAWGINFSRRIRRKNEIDFWSPVPRAYNIARVSLGGNLVGLETGRGGRDLRIKPYVLTDAVRETGTIAAPHPPFDRGVNAGVDLKYALTPGLTLDATARPDFAQAEADEQTVNLTQFSPYYPEKRDFFLENSGVFYVGDAARSNNVGGGTPDEDLLLFFSRRIGLTNEGRVIPIDGGLRVTGKLGEANRIGVLTMQTRGEGGIGANNYAVARARRNLFAGSDVGAFYMQRQSTDSGSTSYNRVYGLDWNLRFFGNVDWNSYVAKSESPLPQYQSGNYAWRTSVNRETNFLHVKLGALTLGQGFDDEMGYLRRTDVRKWFTDIGIRPRPTALQEIGIREMHPHIVWNYYEDLSGRMVAKNLHTGYTFFLNDGGYHELSVNPNFQLITAPLTLSTTQKVPIPVGGYAWNEYILRGSSDPSAPISLGYSLTAGGLWSGTQRTASGTLVIRPSYKFRLTVGGQRTAARLDTPHEHFVTSLITTRANYSFSTTMFVDALSQYDPASKQMNANVRFNLIHHALSDLFIVYNDQRVLTGDGLAPGRSLILKATQMFAF